MSPRVARRTYRLPIILVVAALVAGAIYLDQTAPEASGAGAAAATATAAAAIQGPTVPRPTRCRLRGTARRARRPRTVAPTRP